MQTQLWRSLRQTRPFFNYKYARYLSDSRTFQPGDLVLLREKLNRSALPIFTRPLRSGGRIESHRGVVLHEDIIGKRVRDVVRTLPPKPRPDKKTKQPTELRLHEVKLEEHVRYTRRLVTPVYPADAALIVNVLELHPDPRGPPLEILEAGTGHGALTLYLSRAVHAANSPAPVSDAEEDEDTAATLHEWKKGRRAVVHTIERNSKYSKHAEDVVKGFRNGLYYNNVDFHVAEVGAWTQEKLAERGGTAFLSHAVLDLPNADAHLDTVATALMTDATLVVFNPNLTQILQCYKKIKDEGIPLELETVIELPVNGGASGREWDVRAVKPRAAQAKEVSSSPREGENGEGESEAQHTNPESDEVAAEEAVGEAREEEKGGHEPEGDAGVANIAEKKPGSTTQEDGWQMVCRPKVGDRIVGGGFLGVFKKQRDMREP